MTKLTNPLKSAICNRTERFSRMRRQNAPMFGLHMFLSVNQWENLGYLCLKIYIPRRFFFNFVFLHETFHGFMALLLLENITTTHHVLDRYVLQTFTHCYVNFML